MKELPVLKYTNEEARAEPFGYTCNRCLKCCKGKRIQVNPYEVARLAKNLGIRTSELRDKFTIDGEGTVLDQTDSDHCVFLNEQGCSVHPDRPLVCRLYPLGRQVWQPAEEAFVHIEPHPETKGVYSKDSVVREFLKSQEAGEFMKVADEYFDWFCDASVLFQELHGETTYDTDVKQLLDFDSSIELHCAKLQIPEPIDIEDRKNMHLDILRNFLNTVLASQTNEG